MASAVEDLERHLGADWKAIRNAREKSAGLLAELKKRLEEFSDHSCSVIVTGSLGRGEATSNSDADWYLLVDGPSDSNHARLALKIQERIYEVLDKPVGSTGTFGRLVPSHELVHYIAGTRDTNENLTRRILLLSESHALTNPLIRNRVIGNVLKRYVVDDRSVPNPEGKYIRVPHFLLNDIVRYWRTMASDFASKMWDTQGKGWGTRNIKLRFSRKLIFTWGLLAVSAGNLFPTEALESAELAHNEDEFFSLLANLVSQQSEVTPLDLLARVAIAKDVESKTAERIFTAYDTFLDAMGDEVSRKALEAVKSREACDDPTFDRLRKAGREFRFGINDMFFDQHPVLFKLIREYGVF